MKTTKTMLWAAALTAVLCLTLLIGATFAWFTATVINSGNRIQAGTLSVDLLMDKAGDGNYSSIKDGSGDIFSAGSDGLWEPEKTEIVYLAVKNAGSLAVDYQVILDVEDGGLAGALEYVVLKGATHENATASNWGEFVSAAGGAAKMNGGQTVVLEGEKLAAVSEDTPNGGIAYFALAVHMSQSGNKYQGTYVDVDLNVAATQSPVESDGFGNADYDIEASFYKEVATAEELEAAIKDLASDEAVRLTKDVVLPEPLTLSDSGVTKIDLNENTLTMNNVSESSAVTVSGGEELSIRNGRVVANTEKVENGVFNVTSGGVLNLHDVQYTTTGTGIYPRGDAAQVNISDSVITANGYCVSTNAATADNYDVVVNITDSELNAIDEPNGAGTGILMNVPGELNVIDTVINSQWQSIIARGGSVLIEGCTLTNVYENDAYLHYYDETWYSGNGVNLAVITIGNRGEGYQYPSAVTVRDSILKSVGPYPAIYAVGNEGEGLGATLSYDGATDITGDIIAANKYCTINGVSGPFTN